MSAPGPGPSSFSTSAVLRVPSSDKAAEGPYPVYGAAARWFPAGTGAGAGTGTGAGTGAGDGDGTMLIAIAGGSSGQQFIGCPVHVVNLSKSLMP
jgi:hypothetical protein